MLAKENRIPVVAACETYKFGERVLLDAVTGNELGKLRECSTASVALVIFKLTHICCDHRRRLVPIGTRRRRHSNTSDPDSPLVRPHTSSAYHGDLFRGRFHSSTWFLYKKTKVDPQHVKLTTICLISRHRSLQSSRSRAKLLDSDKPSRGSKRTDQKTGR